MDVSQCCQPVPHAGRLSTVQTASGGSQQPETIPGREALFQGRIAQALRQTVAYCHPIKKKKPEVYAAYAHHISELFSAVEAIPVRGYLSSVFRSLTLGLLKFEPLSGQERDHLAWLKGNAGMTLQQAAGPNAFMVVAAGDASSTWAFKDPTLTDEKKLDLITEYYQRNWRLMPPKARDGLGGLLLKLLPGLVASIQPLHGEGALLRFTRTYFPVIEVFNQVRKSHEFIRHKQDVHLLTVDVITSFLEMCRPRELSRHAAIYYQSLIEECCRFRCLTLDDKSTMMSMLKNASKSALPEDKEADQQLVSEVKALLAQGEGLRALEACLPHLLKDEGGITLEAWALVESFREAIRVVVADLCLSASDTGLQDSVRQEVRQLDRNLGALAECQPVIGINNVTLLELLRGICELPDKARY